MLLKYYITLSYQFAGPCSWLTWVNDASGFVSFVVKWTIGITCLYLFCSPAYNYLLSNNTSILFLYWHQKHV